MVDAPGIAAKLGVAQAWVKDESSRLGLPSFKILGASWAAFRALSDRLGGPVDAASSLRGLRERLAAEPYTLTLVAATDGNHGRAVARIAHTLGLGADILVPGDMSQARIEAIASEGARVTVVEGSYDDAVACSAAEADDRNLVISDTAWPGYERVPRWVVEGYGTIGWEVKDQLAQLKAAAPELVAAQIGVGAFAASVVSQFAAKARVIGVEPIDAACALAAAVAGERVEVPGPHSSAMAGLNCGLVSSIAWPVLSAGISAFVSVTDEDAGEAMRLLAQAGIISGESGAAGLAGLLAFRDELGLAEHTSVLIVSTEGATDPAAYEAAVGRVAE